MESSYFNGRTVRFRLNELSSVIQTVPLECIIESFYLSGHTFSFRLEENVLPSVITKTVPLECAH